MQNEIRVQTQAASYTITLQQGTFRMYANAWRVEVESSCGRLRRHGVRLRRHEAEMAGFGAVLELDLTAQQWAEARAVGG